MNNTPACPLICIHCALVLTLKVPLIYLQPFILHFRTGLAGATVREISRTSCTDIRSWNDHLVIGGHPRKVRTLVIEVKKTHSQVYIKQPSYYKSFDAIPRLQLKSLMCILLSFLLCFVYRVRRRMWSVPFTTSRLVWTGTRSCVRAGSQAKWWIGNK